MILPTTAAPIGRADGSDASAPLVHLQGTLDNDKTPDRMAFKVSDTEAESSPLPLT
jgi:hypothetical protein